LRERAQPRDPRPRGEVPLRSELDVLQPLDRPARALPRGLRAAARGQRGQRRAHPRAAALQLEELGSPRSNAQGPRSVILSGRAPGFGLWTLDFGLERTE